MDTTLIEPDQDLVVRDCCLMKELLLRLSDNPAHMVSVASSLLVNCLIDDIRRVYGPNATQIAEHVMDKIVADVRRYMPEGPPDHVETIVVKVRNPQ